jgi:hypothetical protein
MHPHAHLIWVHVEVWVVRAPAARALAAAALGLAAAHHLDDQRRGQAQGHACGGGGGEREGVEIGRGLDRQPEGSCFHRRLQLRTACPLRSPRNITSTKNHGFWNACAMPSRPVASVW